MCFFRKHIPLANKRIWNSEWGGPSLWAHGTTNSKGVAILLKSSFKVAFTDKFFDTEDRFLFANVKIDNKTAFTLANVYGPNSDKSDFFDLFFQNLVAFSAHDFIIGGNSNLVLNDDDDKCGDPKHKNVKARFTVISHMSLLKLKDVYRVKNPSAKCYTRYQMIPFTATRLDFFLLSEMLCSKVSKAEILPSTKSDHKIVHFQLNYDQDPRGSGFWKFNTSLCTDPSYVTFMKDCIGDFIANNPKGHVNPHVRWDALKSFLRGCTIKYSKTKHKHIKFVFTKLQKLIQTTESLLVKADEHDKQLLQSLLVLQQNELDKHFEYLAKGHAVCSRAKWAELGEKNTKYFLNLEKHNGTAKSINKLRCGNSITADQKEILALLKDFFTSL